MHAAAAAAGYKLAYRVREEGSTAAEIMLKDPGVTEYTITDLSIFRQYLVSLQVLNPEGEGPRSTVVVMTDEGSEYLLLFSYFFPEACNGGRSYIRFSVFVQKRRQRSSLLFEDRMYSISCRASYFAPGRFEA